jgi:hypothetical protein
MDVHSPIEDAQTAMKLVSKIIKGRTGKICKMSIGEGM